LPTELTRCATFRGAPQDYGNYMHQLAAEIGAAPTVSDLVFSPRALVAYALGQAYITFFRLVGPFATKRAWEDARGELFEPIVSRGLAANVVFVGTMAAFAMMNFAAFAAELVLSVVCPRWLARERAAAA
jgi:dimethylaniline monooxygenase (N-oxide forming)